MKKILKVTLLFISMILLSGNNVFAGETEKLEEKLNQLGVSEKYSSNIAEYINNMDITNEDYDDIIENGDSVLTMVEGKNSITDFSLSELYNIYGDIRSIMKQLNLTLKIDIKNRQFAVVDKDTEKILYKGNPKDIDEYYTNYEELLDNGEEALNLEEYIKDLIDSRNGTYNNQGLVEEEDEIYNYPEDTVIPGTPMEVNKTEINNEEMVINEKVETQEKAQVDEEEIENPIEDDVENNESTVEEVKVPEKQVDYTLATNKDLDDTIIYYILGGALIILAVTSGYLKFL